MYFRRPFRRRPYVTVQNSVKRKEKSFTVFLLSAAVVLLIASALFFLQELSADIAVSDASDVVTVNVNRAIAEIMQEEDYSGDYFVTFEKSETGEVTAISSNMARINKLSADGPVREPYIAYMQGGLTYESGKLGIMMAVSAMLDR